MTETLTWTQARRIALRAQGMGSVRRDEMPDGTASRRALARTLERTHLLQIDSVSVFARAHHLPVYTRTGIWDPAALDRASRPGRGRLVHETLAHEAAFATSEVHDLLGFRRRAAAREGWSAVKEAAESSPELIGRILEVLAERGPASAAEVSRHLGDTERGEGWGWRRTESQWTVEYLFRAGALECVGRSAQFERLYIPSAPTAEVLDRAAATVAAADGTTARKQEEIRGLTSRAARALGIADPASLADYFRLRRAEVRPAIEDMLAEGELEEVEMTHPAGTRRLLRHRDAPRPAPLRTAALVSPFDPIAFHRPRLRQLFDVDYRIGIYTPAERRTTGYYSLLFLLGDVFPARVDLRADRRRGVLEVRGAYREELPHLPRRRRPEDGPVAAALAEELERAARWQGLQGVEVATGAGTGALSAALAEARRAAA
ncbi:winged helix-turn-helix domain-containing protein [Brachybacterium sp. YJGR34]|uniref:winged helix-turn-helix domain-containing protein n=1 Tax=Brachybacterium sp. YJGR34 TaxID=2059911 RepID=UPI000E0BE813|nr:crosslink repair DNA glycosylase YcaQ family protein [Brachybacterium sp. YJGR34]